MGTENEGAAESNAANTSDPKKDSLYEDRPTHKKIIRVVTVVAYMVSVSFVAIVLSGYYVFLWQPPNPRLLHRDHLRADPQVEYLVDKPPMEIDFNESLSLEEIRDKVDLFREEILRSRGVNVSFQSQSEKLKKKINSEKVVPVKRVMMDETKRNYSETLLNPIDRGLLSNKENLTNEIMVKRSTDVYESLDDAMKSSTVANSFVVSRVFIESEEINNSSSSSSSYSSSSSTSASSLESEGKLFKPVNDIVSTTATDLDIEDREKINFVTKTNVKRITTRDYDRRKSLGSTEIILDRRENFGDDKNEGDSEIGISGNAEKNAEENKVESFEKSKLPQIWQSLKKKITTSGRRREDLPQVLESVTQVNFIVWVVHWPAMPSNAKAMKQSQSNATASELMQLPRKMSAQNVMASISRTLGTRHDGNTKHSNEVKLAGEESKDKLYEPKHRQKVVRVLTVVAYVVSVSLAAIILSLYYTFIWNPKDHALYTIRQTNLNSTAKVEGFNLTDFIATNGSNITRSSTQSLTNDTDLQGKFSTNFPPENEVSIEIVSDSAEELEPVLNSAASVVPAVIQPDNEITGKKQQSKEQLIEDGDFAFI